MKKFRLFFAVVFITAAVFFGKNGMSGGMSVIRSWLRERTDHTLLDENRNGVTEKLDGLLMKAEEGLTEAEAAVNARRAAFSEEDLSYAHGYYYQFLSESEAKAYDSFESSCSNYLSEVYLPAVDFEEMGNALTAFRNDHPEYYWLNNEILYRQWNGGIAQSASLTVPEDAPDVQKKILKKAKKAVEKAASSCETEYEKYKYFYDYIIDRTEYGQIDERRGQTIEGVFLDHMAVCGGYAAAYKYLCDLAGLKCVKVIGTAGDYEGTAREAHAWNLIWVGEKPYWVDVTWGDPQFEGGSDSWDEGWRDYAYFCALDEDFMKTHQTDYTLGSDSKDVQKENGQRKRVLTVSYPACSDEEFEYFHRKGLYFENSSEAQEYMCQKMRDHSPQIEIKLSSSEAYSEMLSIVTNSYQMGSMAHDTGFSFKEYQYIPDAAFNTLVINFR